MANFNIPENPEYTSEVRKFETTDPAHADLFNAVTQVLLNNDTFLKQVTEQLIKNVNQHIQDTENPHEMTAEQLNLERVDNTSDVEKPVSAAQQDALDALYQQLTGYTDKEIADLINGAPGTLDTLGEIADAMQENEDVVTALEQAIGTKASKAETESALAAKLDKTGDAKDNTVTFTSGDVADGGAGTWTSVAKLTTGEKLSNVLNKVSTMFKNIRYLYKMLGTTDISAIGGGTVTGAISKLNTDLLKYTTYTFSAVGVVDSHAFGGYLINGSVALPISVTALGVIPLRCESKVTSRRKGILTANLTAGGALNFSASVSTDDTYEMAVGIIYIR